MTDISISIPPELLAKIDERRAQVEKTLGKPISRNEWFANMTDWVINRLPHEAVKADLIKAWPNMPIEALGVDK